MAEGKSLTGDIRIDPFEVMQTEQRLTSEEKALLRRGYDLFEFFDRHMREEHGQMRLARAIRRKKQSARSETSPASNTLCSCIDNAIDSDPPPMPRSFSSP